MVLATHRARQMVPIAPTRSVTVVMTDLKTQSFATTVHLGCVVKSGEMEVCQLSLVFHRVGPLLVAEEEVVLLTEEVVVVASIVLLVAEEEVGAPVVLLATFAMFTTAGF